MNDLKEGVDFELKSLRARFVSSYGTGDEVRVIPQDIRSDVGRIRNGESRATSDADGRPRIY